ncbi:MAG: DUF4142 domain-containing protein [Pirellulales bacterium]
MNRSWIRRFGIAGACAAPLTMGVAAWAQATDQARDPAAQNQSEAAQESGRQRDRQPGRASDAERERVHAGEHAAQKLDDRTLAALLLIGNQKEVAVSRLAANRAQNAEVKQFAQEMSQAHGQFIAKLAQLAGARERADGAANPFAPQRDPAGRAARDADSKANSGADAQARTATNPAHAEQGDRQRGEWQRYDLGASPLVSFDRELADQCLQSTERFLGQQQGAEFDKWFMALQLVEHMGMRDKLQVAQRHATGELRALVDQGIQTTDQHIRQAEQVMRQLPHAGGSAAQTSSRPGATKQ